MMRYFKLQGQNPSCFVYILNYFFSSDIVHQIMDLTFSGELKQKWLKKYVYWK